MGHSILAEPLCELENNEINRIEFVHKQQFVTNIDDELRTNFKNLRFLTRATPSGNDTSQTDVLVGVVQWKRCRLNVPSNHKEALEN